MEEDFFRKAEKRFESLRRAPDKHLHSRAHVLADDLSRMMLEPHRFAAYLGLAVKYREYELRALARRVSEKADLPPKARGKYFFACIKSLTPTPTRSRLQNKKRKSKTKIPTKKTVV